MDDMDNIQYPVPKQEYKVLVRCYTFNHSKYIEDALNGFAMQQTEFPFVCLVVDDASTDGEQEVIKHWMEKECDLNRVETIDIPTSIVIIVPHKTNPSCTFAFYLLKQNLYRIKGEKKKHVDPWREKCEYEALCEGDDYWIDSLKLQKQVDFLDKNKNYGLVCSNYKIVNEHNKFIRISYLICNNNIRIENLLLDNPISTASVCIRTELIGSYSKNKPEMRLMLGDLPLWIYVSMFTKIYRMDDIMVAYRLLPNSASHSPQESKIKEFTKNEFDVRLYYRDKFNIKIDKDKILKRYYQVLTRKMSQFSTRVFFKYYVDYIRKYPIALLDSKTVILFFMNLIKRNK